MNVAQSRKLRGKYRIEPIRLGHVVYFYHVMGSDMKCGMVVRWEIFYISDIYAERRDSHAHCHRWCAEQGLEVSNADDASAGSVSDNSSC